MVRPKSFKPRSWIRTLEDLSSLPIHLAELTAKRMVREDFRKFLRSINAARIDGLQKEFFTKVGYLFNNQKRYSYADILADDGNGGIMDPTLIQTEISKSFSNSRSTQSHPHTPLQSADVRAAIERLSRGKAHSKDLVLDTSLHSKKNNRLFVCNLTRLLNHLLSTKNPLLYQGRLVPLNKDPTVIPTVNSLRFINISSPLLKIVELHLESELRIHLTPKLHEKQRGFTQKMSTTHNLAELYQKARDIMDGNGRCLIVFIDLKSAFDTVDHDLLFTRLQNDYSLPPNLVNSIRTIYVPRLGHLQPPFQSRRGFYKVA